MLPGEEHAVHEEDFVRVPGDLGPRFSVIPSGI